MKKRCRVRFKFIEILYFSRCLGIDKVPEKGNNPLGMECYHFESEKIDIAKKKLQTNHFLAGDSLLNIKNLSTSTPKSSKSTSYLSEEDSESIHSVISIDFTPKSLQPMNPNQRKKCLESAGVDIDENNLLKNPKNLSKLREGRKQVGCKCSISGKCDSTKCICSSEGIPCQSDGNKFPCKCGDKCSNKFGKRTYSYAKIKFHYQHTLNRLPSQFEGVDINILSTLNGDCTICSTVSDEICNKYPEVYHQTRSRKREGDLLLENGTKLLKKHSLPPSLVSNGFKEDSQCTGDQDLCTKESGDRVNIDWPAGVDGMLLASYPIINRRLSVELLVDDEVCAALGRPYQQQYQLQMDPEDVRYTNKENISAGLVTSTDSNEIAKTVSQVKKCSSMFTPSLAKMSPVMSTVSSCNNSNFNYRHEHDQSLILSSLYDWNFCDESSFTTEQPTERISVDYRKSFLNTSNCSENAVSTNDDCFVSPPAPLSLLQLFPTPETVPSAIFNTISLATSVNGDSELSLVSNKQCCHDDVNDNSADERPLTSLSPVALSLSGINSPSKLHLLVTDSVTDNSSFDLSKTDLVTIEDKVDICFFDIPVETHAVVDAPSSIILGSNEEFKLELCCGSANTSCLE